MMPNPIQSSILRQQFLDFFQRRQHKVVSAAPVVNKEDPTLMFTNAGMNQFKDFFLGNQSAPYSRAASAQPCLRVSGKHNDLEEVGIDTYHHTLFEMLGNWSFGDYFKEEAIQWAWELLTEVYQLSPDRLYVTVFEGDQQDGLSMDSETESIWKRHIAAEHILLGNKADNFWEMGAIGPCGPCTEIHVDIRPEEERNKVPGRDLVNKDHPQVVELWNIVFIQHNRLAGGQLEALPENHVDTGMGLERLVMIMQAKTSNYDTDLFVPLTQAISQMIGKPYGQDQYIDIAMRVIVDHLRAIAFVIADGQSPSNTKAGYVIRRILRRAVRYGYTYLGLQAPFIHQLVATLVQQLQDAYPQLLHQQEHITKTILDEEHSFFRTLTTGLQRLEQIGKTMKGQPMVLSGEDAFELYDTYGFPLDLTLLIAKEKSWKVDEKGFEQALQAQRQRSKQAAISEEGDWIVVKEGTSTFVGYDTLEAATQILKYRTVKMRDQESYQVVLEQTPFYPEGGGQVGDQGHLCIGQESIRVLGTQKESGLIIHQTAQLPTMPTATLRAVVDHTRRALISNNHTATHLLHAALKTLLGPHVEQRGSLVNEQLLRFDFSHTSSLTDEEVKAIEQLVNQKIRANIALQDQRQVPLEEAKAQGVTALFGEKYGDAVRVVTFDKAFSMELCGGTHVAHTGMLGLFKIRSTTAVAAGIRRIEAITAHEAEQWMQQQADTVKQIQTLLKHPQDLCKAVQQIIDEKGKLVKQLAHYENAQVEQAISQLQSQLVAHGNLRSLITQVTVPNANALKQIAVALQQRQDNSFIVLVADIAGKPHIAVALSASLLSTWPHDAKSIVQQLAKPIQGGGGGKPTMATAGGKFVAGLSEALQLAQDIVVSATTP